MKEVEEVRAKTLVPIVLAVLLFGATGSGVAMPDPVLDTKAPELAAFTASSSGTGSETVGTSPALSPSELVDWSQEASVGTVLCVGDETEDVLEPHGDGLAPSELRPDPKEGDYDRCTPDPSLGTGEPGGASPGRGSSSPDVHGARETATRSVVPEPEQDHDPPSQTFRMAAGPIQVVVPDPTLSDLAVRVVAAGGSVAIALAFLVLYRRLRKDEVLDNDLRSRMMEIVEDDPGVHARAVARRLDVDVKTVLYHGRVLEEVDLIDVHEGSGRVAYFERGRHNPRDKELRLARRQESKRAILDLLRRDPGRSMAELARSLDVHRSTVKRHVDDLVDRGLVTSRRDGRTRRVELEETVLGLLAG